MRSLGWLLALALRHRLRRAPGSAIARSAPESFAPLVKRVLPAVVNIAVTETVSGGEVLRELPPELRDTPLGREFRRRFGNRREQTMGAGSGFIIDPIRPDRDQQPRGRPRRQDRGLAHRRHAAAGPGHRHRRTDRRGADQGAGVRPIARRGVRRLARGGGGRLGARRRQSVRSGRLGHRRHHLGARPRPGLRSVRQFPAARCADQSGQLRRADLQHGRPGDRDQHRHRLAVRRLGRHRLRHAQRTGDPDRRPVARQRPYRARLARRVGGGRPTRRRDGRRCGAHQPRGARRHPRGRH